MGVRCTCAAVFLLAIGTASCGGTPTSPAPMAAPSPSPAPAPTPAPTPAPSPGPSPMPASPLPLGAAVSSGTIPCPAGTGPTANSSCLSLVVSCPSIASAAATLRITRPSSAGSTRGTVVLTTGGAGTNFQDSPLTQGMITTFFNDNLNVVEVRWDPPGIWGDPRARTAACRYATAARWIYDNVHVGGRTRLFAAQGTSGGAAQIAFGLANYGIGEFVDLANLGGGPPNCPLCAPTPQVAQEPLLSSAMSPTCFSAPNASIREPVLNYATTIVRSFLGDQDPNSDCTADNARAFSAAITSTKSFSIVPNTPHVIESTQTGVDAYVASVRSALK